MKALHVLLWLSLLHFSLVPLRAQRIPCSEATYRSLMDQASQLAKQGRYDLAIKKYTSAKTCKPGYTPLVDREIARVFIQVGNERDRAVAAERQARRERDRAEQRRKEAVANQLAAISSNALYVDKSNSDALQLAKLAMAAAAVFMSDSVITGLL